MFCDFHICYNLHFAVCPYVTLYNDISYGYTQPTKYIFSHNCAHTSCVFHNYSDFFLNVLLAINSKLYLCYKLILAECDPTYTFACANGKCIPKYYVCNLDNDCGDFSDELQNCCKCFSIVQM